MKRILVTWVGKTDLRAAAGEIKGWGPIGNAVQERPFEGIVLLSNYSEAESEFFVEWLSRQTAAAIDLRAVSLCSPMDFREVYEAADQCVQQILESGTVDLTFHLSPGTPAMMAMWLILATTKYDARLIASSPETGVYEPEFPFDIAADYLPRKTASARSKSVTAIYEERTIAAFDRIIHSCDAMKRVIARAQRVAQFDVSVMILGESGTGKELFAEAIHNASPRAAGPYVAVNCGAFPKDLVESELFGHVKGAFTGATDDRIGCFEQADHGTLFLDELGELPLLVQVKLLRALQDGRIQRVGDHQPRKVDVRIICATNKDLPTEIHEGRFREDLFHRLAIGVLNLPPLRERHGDLQRLVQYKLGELEKSLTLRSDQRFPRLSAGANTVIRQQSWRGNIRELFNALTRAVIWCESEKISKQEMMECLLSMQHPSTFSTDAVPLGGDFHLDTFLKEIRQQLIERAISQSNSQKQAAQLLGISDSNLRQKIKSLNSAG